MEEEILLSGTVKRGRSVGKGMGFPTLNLRLNSGEPPEEGVYGAYVYVDGREYEAVAHYGPKPTFDNDKAVFEAHLIGGSGDFYGKKAVVKILGKIRGIKQFGSVELLKAQIQQDIACARRLYFTMGLYGSTGSP